VDIDNPESQNKISIIFNFQVWNLWTWKNSLIYLFCKLFSSVSSNNRKKKLIIWLDRLHYNLLPWAWFSTWGIWLAKYIFPVIVGRTRVVSIDYKIILQRGSWSTFGLWHHKVFYLFLNFHHVPTIPFGSLLWKTNFRLPLVICLHHPFVFSIKLTKLED